jgi:nucleoside-diphosphate-sugar epimerase
LHRRGGEGFLQADLHYRNPRKRKVRLANVRAEDVAGAVIHLSLMDGIGGQIYNIADDSNPTIEEALGMAARAFGKKPPTLHLPLWLVGIAARADGMISARKGKVPDLECDAVKYLVDDYIVDNSKLKKAGFKFLYPDFGRSMEEIAKLFSQGKLEMR